MRAQSGVSALHVLIALAVISVLTGWGMTYKRFQDRMHMAKVNSHYVAGIKLAREVLPIENPAPSASQWASILNTGARQAPGGGPAFIVNDAGSDISGAVGVAVDDYGAAVRFARPRYRTLSPSRAVIRGAIVTYTENAHGRT